MTNDTVPADETALPGIVVTRYNLPAKVDYVPALSGASERVAGNLSTSADGMKVTFSSPSPGIYEISGTIEITKEGSKVVRVESESPCFMRIHRGHAVDLQTPGVDVSAKRKLGVGLHPFKLIIRSEAAGLKTTWAFE